MAQKTDETEKPTRKPLLFKQKFTVLISLLLVIIILLCVIVGVLVTLNVSANSENSQNSTESHNEMFNRGEMPSSYERPEIVTGSSHKMIYRDSWGGRPPLYERPQKLPVKYVIISHTGGKECFSLSKCSQHVLEAQSLHVKAGSPDVGYNFLIGGDTNIYVARGWDNHNFHMNLDTIGISFIGNYIYGELTPGMIEATHHLLKYGVEKGKLAEDYILVAHNQTWNTLSPGPNIYKQIKFWPHFSPDSLTDIDK